MTIEGLDFAWARPSASAIAADGASFVMRYLSYDDGKNLQPSEVVAYHALGIDVGTVWESTGGRALQGGYDGGRSDAREADLLLSSLRAALGPLVPDAPVVYFAVDEATSAAEETALANYYAGAQSILGASRVGDYGSWETVQLLRDTVEWHWQTYAWSGGRVHERAHIWQYANGAVLHPSGVTVDRNRALRFPYGSWWGWHGPRVVEVADVGFSTQTLQPGERAVIGVPPPQGGGAIKFASVYLSASCDPGIGGDPPPDVNAAPGTLRVAVYNVPASGDPGWREIDAPPVAAGKFFVEQLQSGDQCVSAVNGASAPVAVALEWS